MPSGCARTNAFQAARSFLVKDGLLHSSAVGEGRGAGLPTVTCPRAGLPLPRRVSNAKDFIHASPVEVA